jgi:hypothetical protein
MILSAQFNGINYFYNVFQPSPVSISKPFHHPKQNLYTH